MGWPQYHETGCQGICLNRLCREQIAKEKTAREALKRKASEVFDVKDEIIALLLPPKSAKTEYDEQKPAKYVFKCMDGDIQIPEYGMLRTEFYYQERIISFIRTLSKKTYNRGC